jgi:hypothetical protein
MDRRADGARVGLAELAKELLLDGSPFHDARQRRAEQILTFAARPAMDAIRL